MNREDALSALADRWRDVPAKELANAQSYVIELCEALGVERPRPSGSGYEFEFAVRIVNRDGSESANRVDLFKEGHFLLESKDEPERTDESAELRLRRAFGQASSYAAFVPGGPPPYLMVLDVGRTLRLWDRWAGSYGGFQGAVRTIDLTRLAQNPDDVEFLRLVWEDPKRLDPNVKSAEVTREIATKLAKLAARLEATGEDQERVARFLIRCVFTMFAEDVGLLKDDPFTIAVEKGLSEEPIAFEGAVDRLWATMDAGGDFGHNHVLRFNGHFFHDRDVIPLDRDALAVLLEAARADWAHVEPSIFGTLLTRALDREERHRLGAEFTPRAYVERLVRPTIEEPVRERWTLVQAEVLQLREHGTAPARKKAVERLRSFHDYLRSIRVLDPACGSGNFLYVSLNLLKEIELEVTREIEEITGQKEHDVDPVGPHQFHGIEVKLWAREVAELCLWVGYHQWWKKTHQHTQPPEPVLQDTGTLEHRDAVLAWDDIREVPEKSRPDPTPRIPHPVTGDLVPDPEARLPYYEYVGARQAEWPEADFIVGNPPYMGQDADEKRLAMAMSTPCGRHIRMCLEQRGLCHVLVVPGCGSGGHRSNRDGGTHHDELNHPGSESNSCRGRHAERGARSSGPCGSPVGG